VKSTRPSPELLGLHYPAISRRTPVLLLVLSIRLWALVVFSSGGFYLKFSGFAVFTGQERSKMLLQMKKSVM